MDLSETFLQRIADNLDGMLKDLLGEHVRVIQSDFNLPTIENANRTAFSMTTRAYTCMKRIRPPCSDDGHWLSFRQPFFMHRGNQALFLKRPADL